MKINKILHHKYFKNFFNAFCTIFIIFLLLELSSRIFLSCYYYYRYHYTSQLKPKCHWEEYSAYEDPTQCLHSQDTFPIVKYDTFVGYILAQNQKGNGWRTNKQHLRYDIDIPQHKPHNEVRIFITGGSTAWGVGVTQHQTFAHILENLLNKYDSTKIYRVMIGAISGWGSLQEVIFAKNYITELKPDLIIMFSSWNDITASRTGFNLNKLNRLNFRQLIFSGRNHSRAKNMIYMEKYNPKTKLIEPSYYESNFKFFYIIRRILFNFYTLKKHNLEKKLKKIQLPSNKVIRNIKANIDLMKFLSKKYNFNFLYCLQPSLNNTQKTLSKEEISLIERFKHSHVGLHEYDKKFYIKLRPNIKDYLKNQKIPFLDGDQAIMNEKKTVFVDNIHLGSRGNKLVGQLLFEFIKENFLAKGLLSNRHLAKLKTDVHHYKQSAVIS